MYATRPCGALMNVHGFRKFRTVAGSDCAPRPTLTQHRHGFCRTHAFQTKLRQRCSRGLAAVRWHGPRGILLPTPKPVRVR